MEISERIDDITDAVRAAIQGELRAMFKIMPVIAQSSDGHTVTMQSAVTAIFKMPDGSIQNPPMAQFQDAPAHFPGGGGVTDTHPINNGDEGLILFTDRSQDAWHQNGGADNVPLDNRTHHISDGRYIPGGRSDPRKMDPAPSSTSHQKRADDGNHVLETHPQNGVTHASTAAVKSISGSSSTTHTPDGIRHEAGQINMNCT